MQLPAAVQLVVALPSSDNEATTPLAIAKLTTNNAATAILFLVEVNIDLTPINLISLFLSEAFLAEVS